MSRSNSLVKCRCFISFTFLGALALHGAFFGPFFGPINLADVQCTGDEEFLLNCSFTSNHDCFHSNDVSVRCPCFHGDVRLVDGDNNRSGRVELCLNGVWGTVADQQWTTMDAQVVCAQLGFVPNCKLREKEQGLS